MPSAVVRLLDPLPIVLSDSMSQPSSDLLAKSKLKRCTSDGLVQSWIMASRVILDGLRQQPRLRGVLRRINLPEDSAHQHAKLAPVVVLALQGDANTVAMGRAVL